MVSLALAVRTTTIQHARMQRYEMPPEVRAELSSLVASASSGRAGTAALERLIARASELPPKAIFEIEDLVGHLRHPRAVEQWTSWFRRGPASDDKIEPQHAPVLMLNKNGHVREAALSVLTQLPDSAFFVAALAWRLNDWVQPVRRAAAACADRVLPQMSVQAIVGAASFLLGRLHSWGRWEEPPDVLLRAIGRPDCIAALAAQLARSAEIPAGALRAAMRLGLLDDHVQALSRTAVRPEFRAALLKAMLDLEVTWVTHYEREWVDKRYGITRRVPVLGRRRLQLPVSVDALIRQGAEDRSVLVRRIAASGLVKHAADLPHVKQLMQLFAADKSPSIRWRMDYLARRV